MPPVVTTAVPLRYVTETVTCVTIVGTVWAALKNGLLLKTSSQVSDVSALRPLGVMGVL